ncbi:nuclease-related domain-containing protein [Desulfurobacterium atlanticum]|uniref:Nuclease-related domain-containing protein n=1 Tax=Desulfurobacterium atlanticum TaxID=240169 RepID=A0A238YZ27_9BACT|nr:nuclease-related domain-containing protein [Desulfurobacterium atlanticum]SNR75991.1 Nuclease-related domain-containing protein [Desulfurobacterium atlanticum]
MIIKEATYRKKEIEELEKLLKREDLTKRQIFLIERELYRIRKGIKGEKDAAYFINFYFKDSKNWFVLHDLRLEYKGRVAQIDHLLINRLFHIYILETKNMGQKIEITETGEFIIHYKKSRFGIPSPIEQNLRHQALLKEIIENEKLLPVSFGIRIKPRYFSYVLVHPNTIIKRPQKDKFDTSSIIKADQIYNITQKNAENLGIILDIVKLSSEETVKTFARKLLRFHRKSEVNWYKYFNIKEKITDYKPPRQYFCAKCKATISEKEALYCWDRKKIFGGKAYCYKCQQIIRKGKSQV